MKAKVYQYEKCSTCRKAIAWLREKGIEFSSFPIRQRTPTLKELKTMVNAHGGEVRKLFNTSSKDYRDPDLKELLPTLSEKQVLDLLRERGNLIKRPFVVGDGIALQGFKPDAWEKAFSDRP
ncbi:MAG: Spx/MgsR family RNA polymerase-binding regulatory protein [Opitutae bacterium]|nr:Spx/MgsR family RNA polymerase-binding regulatory protein [Opitutae bacterium]